MLPTGLSNRVCGLRCGAMTPAYLPHWSKSATTPDTPAPRVGHICTGAGESIKLLLYLSSVLDVGVECLSDQ